MRRSVPYRINLRHANLYCLACRTECSSRKRRGFSCRSTQNSTAWTDRSRRTERTNRLCRKPIRDNRSRRAVKVKPRDARRIPTGCKGHTNTAIYSVVSFDRKESRTLQSHPQRSSRLTWSVWRIPACTRRRWPEERHWRPRWDQTRHASSMCYRVEMRRRWSKQRIRMHLEKNTIGGFLEQARKHSPTEDIDRVEKKTKSHSRVVGVRCLMEETSVTVGR